MQWRVKYKTRNYALYLGYVNNPIYFSIVFYIHLIKFLKKISEFSIFKYFFHKLICILHTEDHVILKYAIDFVHIYNNLLFYNNNSYA